MYEPGSEPLEDGSPLDAGGTDGSPFPEEAGEQPTVTRVSATYIHAARIDESGLLALARRAREQARFQAIGQLGRTLAEGGVPPPRTAPDPDPDAADLILPTGARRSA